MPQPKRRRDYPDTEEGQLVMRDLQYIANSELYVTDTMYSPNAELYPDHRMPFVDKHMNYIIDHPMVEADKYVANLRIRTLIR